MSATIDINDFSITGVAVISDSLDWPVNMEDFTHGLNGFVIYSNKYYIRYLVVEFRSKTALTTFLSGLDDDNGGQVSFDGKTYYSEGRPAPPENWGGAGGQWTGAAWTCNITLVRE